MTDNFTIQLIGLGECAEASIEANRSGEAADEGHECFDTAASYERCAALSWARMAEECRVLATEYQRRARTHEEKHRLEVAV